MEKVNDNRSENTAVFSGRHFLQKQAQKEQFALRMAVLAGTISTLLMLTQWVSFALLAETIIVEKHSIDDSLDLLLLMLFCVVCKAIFTRLQTALSQKASLNIRQNIRQVMLQHWRHSSPIRLKDKSCGSFATQFIEEIESMDGYFSRYWPQQALSVISPLLILSVVAYFNWLCALLLLISAPLIPLFMILVGMGAESLNQRYSTIRQRLAGHFLDRVANLVSIRLLNAQAHVLEEVTAQSEQYRNIIMKTLKVAFLSSTVLEFFTSVAIAALAIYIGFSLYGAITWGPANSITLFSGLTILILAPEFFQPLRTLSQYYHDRASALGAANNLLEFIGTSESVHSENQLSAAHQRLKLGGRNTINDNHAQAIDGADKHDTAPVIRLSKLSLGYQEKHALCEPLDVALLQGEILVVTGPSGTGKTTLLDTIAGFIPALSGTIECTIDSLKAMAYLPQQAWIKNATIKENILALAPEATSSQILAVLAQLGLDSELAINHRGLDTVIGEHGQGLSGGQMQRLAFARLLLNPTPVVLLDEPTAKLDPLSKTYIIEGLKTLQKKSTLIIATHDPLLIAMSDIHLQLNSVAISNE